MRVVSLLFTLLLIPALAAEADPAGYRTLSMTAPHHGRALQGAIWYPAGQPGDEMTVAGNAVFFGVTVSENATMDDGQHPLVMLSHGLGGHFRSLAWLASGLAERGAIVIAVNHPNSTWGDFDLEAMLDHWTRVEDLALLLDWALADAEVSPHVDRNRVMAAGFSYGGWTALSMGGLRANPDGFAAYCQEHLARSTTCQELARAGIDLGALPAQKWAASQKDDRITRVASIDPALTWRLDGSHAIDLVGDVTLIGLGEGVDRLAGTDFDASGFAGLLPDATILRLAPAGHFSVLPLCRPGAEAILKAEGEDPVCTDPDGTDRAGIHAAVLDRLAADLGL